VTRRVLAVVFAAPWVLWALARTLGLDGGHPVVGAMSYTPYIAASSPLPIVAALLLRRRVTAAVAGLAALALGLAIVPRAVAGGEPDVAGPRLTVMTANVYEGRGDAREVLALVRRYDVDVLSLQELTPSELARLDAAGAAQLLPGRAVVPREGAAGTGLLARRTIRALPGRDAGDHAQPQARLDVPGAPALLLTAVHPGPPLSDAREDLWAAALDELPATADAELRILAGDFNATLDHRALRRVLDRGYADAAERAGAGLRPTWPGLRRRALPITIDHVLVDRRVRVERVRVARIPGSDHRAVIARLRLPAGQ
jgi:endonuclease/exonuclease/phosphatase (EEP) superfamily protein YafD